MIILFLNHKNKQCGVYQYGNRLFNILNKSIKNKYIYKEIDNYIEYIDYIYLINPNFIIYNYHSLTMGWLDNNNIQKNFKNIGILHESDTFIFDIYLNINPNDNENEYNYNIPRPIFENTKELINNYKINNNKIQEFINYNEGNDVPIFGSFGFAFFNKGFDKIVKLINENYSRAIIKLVVTIHIMIVNIARKIIQ